HHSPSTIANISAERKIFHQVKPRCYFAGSNDFDIAFQPKPCQTVIYKGQRVTKRHPNRTGELKGRRASTAFTPIDRDKIRINTRFIHRFTNRYKFTAMADTEFKTDRFP